MAGLIRFKGGSWSVATWAFENVRESLLEHLSAAESPVLTSMLNEISESHQLFVDVQELPADEVAVFERKVRDLLAQYEAKGAASFHKPEFYPGFLDVVRQLIELISNERSRVRP